MERTLLIIDDSAAIRQQVMETITQNHLFQRVLQANSGVEGFKLLVNNHVDVILCDIEMPGIDGLKFLALLQSREDLNDKPVIMLTSHDDVASKVRGLESGASDYIIKPFEPAELIARLKVHLQLKTLQDELRRSNRLLLELSQTDPLTRLCNRRSLTEMLENELNRCQRNLSPCALIMCDIDHFKNVNDKYGHQAGDEVLILVADLLREHLRPYDLAARYGGEEFCLVLPETNLAHAAEVADRIRQRIENYHFSGNLGPLKLTISLGVAAVSGDKLKSEDELIRMADEALYLAKNNGRNRVETIQSPCP
ncbi:diguanylate cyclase [Geopsychrobacter electrodiphilus]|uniref:diguanylate cyclase n=1 Tax=Geopsychrobacter electrodiphilus TaxID=225196 RepID=UPI00037303D2|nr:diguanylate cyclase [Geopsychrobacter electrodiphilus]